MSILSKLSDLVKSFTSPQSNADPPPDEERVAGPPAPPATERDPDVGDDR